MTAPLAFRPHPWHGLDPGAHCPEIVTAYIEMVPTDGVKYESDKHSGYLEIVLEARPIGGLRMVENAEADDKIIAVLLGDPTFGELVDVRQLPRAVVDRLRHYFLTYKTIPGEAAPTITLDPVYDAAEARAVITAARADYVRRFPAADA